MATQAVKKALHVHHHGNGCYNSIDVARELSIDRDSTNARKHRAYHKFEIDTPRTSHLNSLEFGYLEGDFELSCHLMLDAEHLFYTAGVSA